MSRRAPQKVYKPISWASWVFSPGKAVILPCLPPLYQQCNDIIFGSIAAALPMLGALSRSDIPLTKSLGPLYRLIYMNCLIQPTPASPHSFGSNTYCQ